MSTPLAILFIVGKALIWLGIPLAIGLWELRRHKKMMAAEARGEPAAPSEIPSWLRAAPRAVPARRGPSRPSEHTPHTPAPRMPTPADASAGAAAAAQEPRRAA